ncbi:hypothetical protein DRJ22_05120 [Candidatus Woesearchaeota archaeon]|nr:MAG: hypothetical protein DRJ22_05120 [Candidatus Woesearchaeota archaeon]
MKYPDNVLTKGKKGIEVRSLVSRGNYVLCEYLDPETGKLADKKKKLILKDDDGKVQEYFIVPLKGDRSLLITPKEKKDVEKQKVWNKGKIEDLIK